jgi:hypothetical protein
VHIVKRVVNSQAAVVVDSLVGLDAGVGNLVGPAVVVDSLVGLGAGVGNLVGPAVVVESLVGPAVVVDSLVVVGSLDFVVVVALERNDWRKMVLDSPADQELDEVDSH